MERPANYLFKDSLAVSLTRLLNCFIIRSSCGSLKKTQKLLKVGRYLGKEIELAHILLIDDDNNARKVLRKMLERMGHTVTEAVDGSKGIKAYNKNEIDLVVTDIVMPEKEGIEMIFEMRRINPEVKIIAMSGGGTLGSMEYLEMAEKLGARRSISKPIKYQDFLETIEETLNEE